MRKQIDLTGQRFGRLVVICENGRAKSRHVLWSCRCDCGNEVTVDGVHLRRGDTTSCSCLQRERVSECNTKHGMRNTRLYYVWQNMLTRTGAIKGANERLKRDYIDRGITVCDEWKTFENFRDWALSHNYSGGLQIDRIDNESGYSHSNCRWVSPRENCRNKRNNLRYPNGELLIEVFEKQGFQSYIDHNITPEYSKALHEFHKFGTFCIDMPF